MPAAEDERGNSRFKGLAVCMRLTFNQKPEQVLTGGSRNLRFFTRGRGEESAATAAISAQPQVVEAAGVGRKTSP